MNKKKIWMFRILAIAALIAVAGVMMVIGRGHTVYFDNVALEYEGASYTTPYRVDVYVKEERAAKLKEGERGMSPWMGQNFKMTLEITQNKGEEPTTQELNVKLPWGMDGIILNLPALLAELPEEAYLSEFIPAVVEEPAEEETPGGEEGDMMGEDMMEGLGDV